MYTVYVILVVVCVCVCVGGPPVWPVLTILIA